MSNRFRQVSAVIQKLTPAEAEVWILAEVERLTPGTEIRGRLMGPRCPKITTIEVAYPLRQLPQPDEAFPLTRRAIIPDPSLWEPERPFIYRAIVELWQDGERCDTAEFDCGMRMNEKHPVATFRSTVSPGSPPMPLPDDQYLPPC